VNGREIVLDTETTGLDPEMGDRVIEIGCIELINLVPTGKVFHHLVNPERSVSAETISITGITDDKLVGKPTFVEIAADLIDFIGDEAVLVAHNASFDAKFVNHELKRCGFRPYEPARWIDTVQMARRQAPGAPASLDALCKRFGIDNSNRVLHGALLDAQLLAEVYLELRGGRQPDLVLGEIKAGQYEEVGQNKKLRPARPHAPSEAEMAAHAAFLAELKDPLWAKFAKAS
jgi:DNA polymerase-3 subunit epsilon